MNWLNSFFAFNTNAISNIAYIVQSNIWFLPLIIGNIGVIFLNIRTEIDLAVSEEQNII